MDEEKPTFKITDRRLFNPDGSPRENTEREEPAPANVITPSTSAPETARANQSSNIIQSADAPAAQARANAPTGEQTSGRQAASPVSAAAPPREASGSIGANQMNDAGGAIDDELPPSADAQDFINLIMFIASPAAAALGLTEHPATGGREVDLPLAKHCIDLLLTVQRKTRNNLGFEESQTLEGLLGELQMQYVSLVNQPRAAPAPRGFTGGDITGGR